MPLAWAGTPPLHWNLKGIDPDNVKVKVSIGERVELSDRGLPTGVVSPLSDDEIKFRNEGQSPCMQ